MSFRKGMMISMGKLYENLYKLPRGESLVRKLARNIARMAFHSPGSVMKKRDSAVEIKDDLVRMCGRMDIVINVTKADQDKFEFLVPVCPYLYQRRDQEGVCDAAMDMDRTLIRLGGGKLIIEESVTRGDPVCRITVRLQVMGDR
jgi:hypothetical protein